MSEAIQTAEQQAPSKQRLRLWLEMLRTSRFIENQVRGRLRSEFGETLPRFDLMAALHRSRSPMTMTELSRYLLVSNGKVTGLVDQLVEDGLVTRRQKDGDRRTIFVQLTPRGNEIFSAMATIHEGWIDELLGPIGSDVADGMHTTLQRIRKGEGKS